jgi:hypothetical protein
MADETAIARFKEYLRIKSVHVGAAAMVPVLMCIHRSEWRRGCCSVSLYGVGCAGASPSSVP